MTKIYNIEVDCANCANKMEEAAKKADGVNNVTISFMTQKMTVEFSENYNPDKVITEIKKICKKIESDFELYI